MGAHQEPEFQRPETAAQHHGPFGIIGDFVLTGCLQIFRPDGEGAHLQGRIAQELHRAIELRTQPLVRIDDDAVRALNAIPQLAELRADHGRSRPGRIHMQVEVFAGSDLRHGADIVPAAATRATHAGDDAGRQISGLTVGGDGGLQRLWVHRPPRPFDGNAHQIVCAKTCKPHRPVNGGVHLARAIDTKARLAGKAFAVAAPAKGALAQGQHGGQRGGGGRILQRAGKICRKANRLTEPVRHPAFQLGCRR